MCADADAFACLIVDDQLASGLREICSMVPPSDLQMNFWHHCRDTTKASALDWPQHQLRMSTCQEPGGKKSTFDVSKTETNKDTCFQH